MGILEILVGLIVVSYLTFRIGDWIINRDDYKRRKKAKKILDEIEQ